MIYFIPGAGDTKKDYKPFLTALKKQKVQFLDLSLDDIYNLPTFSEDDVLIGHSVGAVLAYLIAIKQPLKHLILCSPSPLIVKVQKTHAKKIDLLLGIDEDELMQWRGKVLSKKWDIEMISVAAGHNINAPEYIEAVAGLL
jgi:predicted esterase